MVIKTRDEINEINDVTLSLNLYSKTGRVSSGKVLWRRSLRRDSGAEVRLIRLEFCSAPNCVPG